MVAKRFHPKTIFRLPKGRLACGKCKIKTMITKTRAGLRIKINGTIKAINILLL
jgi:hypothetical protein